MRPLAVTKFTIYDFRGYLMISRTLRKKIKDSLSIITYEKIILFGSQSRGDYSKQSDLDLLIILENNIPINKKICLSTQLRKRLAAKMIDADVLIKDKNDVSYLKDKPGSVVRNALLEGIPI